MNTRNELEKNSRGLWETLLLDVNDSLKENGDAYKTEDDIKQLASITPMRTIYPLLHSSYKLNWDYAEKNKETVDKLSGSMKVFELSNMYWLLGIRETLNRDSLVKELKKVATVQLPQLKLRLQGSLEDV